MKATLISKTEQAQSTILSVWDASRGHDALEDIMERHNMEKYGIVSDDDQELFERIVEQEIPVAQFITFVFLVEDVPISWREQAVRHRIGVKWGENYAVDIIPEADISFWSQTMRVMNMGTFAAERKFFIPQSIEENAEALDIYIECMERIEDAYNELLGLGIPVEDARNLIPLGSTHRIAMSINLQSLRHIIGHRGCWIAQSGMWAPVITSMVDELAEKVHPTFRRIIYPPCIKHNEFAGCAFEEESQRRYDGIDPMPVCPLWAAHNNKTLTGEQRKEMRERIPEYEQLWGRSNIEHGWG